MVRAAPARGALGSAAAALTRLGVGRCVHAWSVSSNYYPTDSSDVPAGCYTAYQLCVLVFASVMIPMSLMDLSEQVLAALGAAR